nr:hypothetical protein [Tanacetum cinerariifolium]
MENVPPPNNNPILLKKNPFWIKPLLLLSDLHLNGLVEDDSEVINPYEEADTHNRQPLTSNEETEFASPMVQIADADDVPTPHVIHFGSNFHVGKSSATRDLLACNNEVYIPSPMCCDLKSVHRGVKRLRKQMHDRENRSENSKMMKLITSLSKKFTELMNQNRRAKELSRWEAWVRGRIPNNLLFQEEPSIYTAHVPRTDDPYVMVRDASIHTQGDEDVDTDAHWDTPPSEPRGSPRDSQYSRIICSFFILISLNWACQFIDLAERERVRREATRAGGPAGGPAAIPMAQECSFAGFMKCGPRSFIGLKVLSDLFVGSTRWRILLK